MPLPNVKVNINNVSMDYFLRGVDAAKEAAAAKSSGAQPAGVKAAESKGQQDTSSLVSKLDLFLVRAAKASTHSVAESTVRKAFGKFVDSGILSDESLELLADTANTASDTFKALNSYSGKKLATAPTKDGKFDTKNAVGQNVAAAIKAQQDMTDLLAQFGRQLHAMDGHNGVEIPGQLFELVNDMRTVCERRATEINRLVFISTRLMHGTVTSVVSGRELAST